MSSSISPYNDKHLKIRAAILHDMDQRWQPHKGQELCRNAMKDPECTFVFNQCGRKWGKTTWELRELCENALLPKNLGEINYYVAPEEEQAEEIVWLERRPFKLFDPSLVEKVYEQDMRIVFKNQRQLLCGGANNAKAAAGVQPSMLGVDELKDVRPKFWEVMEPNLAVFNAQTMFSGTPPDGPGLYTELAQMCQELMTEGKAFYTRQPTWMNDKIPGLIKWLEEARKRYIKRGEEHIFNREYGALYIPGGRRQIFPMFDWMNIVKSRRWMIEHIKANARRLNWYCIADPATESVFAVLFAAVNPDTKDIYIVDLIYQRDRFKTSSGEINPEVMRIVREWNPNVEGWQFSYDDHEGWFQLESQKIKDSPPWQPVGKYARAKSAGVSAVKDALRFRKFWVNVECEWINTEFANYCTDENGKIPKGRDHTIDCVRYLLTVCGWDWNELEAVVVPDEIKNDPFMMIAMKSEEAIDTDELLEDWTKDMFNDWMEGPIL